MALVLHDVEIEGGDVLPGENLRLDSDGEDPVERNEYEIEEDIIGYEEEPPIKHNVLPESDSEEEVEERRGQSFDRRGDGKLYVGQTFYNGVGFKEAVLDYALRTATNIKQVRYDKTKLAYRCIGSANCQWRIYCSVTSKSANWKVRVYNKTHDCESNGECDLMKLPVIARLFLDKIREEPEHFLPKKIEETIWEKWGINVTRNQCQAARGKALKWIEREYEDQFKRLRDYGNEILVSNPGSTVEIECLKNDEGEDVFNRFYVCFEVLKRSWKQNCRPLIGIDGAFLRGRMKGQLLAAIGRDADNRIYPIAWGVVGVENTDNWVWFVKKLRADLSLGQGAGSIIVSDRQKGLIKAVSTELPEIEHRMCARHIYGNLKAKHGKKTQMKPFVWNLAWSYNSVEYGEHLDRLLDYDIDVYQDVVNSDPERWCRAFYKIDGNHCEDVENNSTESFNKSIVKAREKQFVPMLETIRRLAMVRIAKRSIKAEKHRGLCTPYVSELLKLEKERSKNCTVKPSTNGQYEAIISGCSHRVHLERKTCTCQKWDITGIPCVHAYSVIIHKKLQVENFVSRWFHTTLWQKTYQQGISPLRGARFWPRGTQGLVHEPPQTEKKSKKEKRKKGKNESPQKKKQKKLKRIMHCKICGAAGHNSRFHKKKQKVSDASGSQMESSQVLNTYE